MKSVRILAVMALVILTSQAWAGGGAHANSAVKADEKAVHADKEALDAAETAAGLPETFPPHKAGAKGHHSSTPSASASTETPAQRISHHIKHVEKELAKVAKLTGQANLPSAVSSAAQTLTSALNKLKADLTAEETSVGTK